MALAAGGSDEWAILNFYELPEKTGLGKTETLDVDMVVVGAGTSGIISATSAIENYKELTGKDLKVLLIESAGKIGGTSAFTHEPFGVNPPRLKADKNNGEDWIEDVPGFTQKWLDWNKDPDGNQRCKPELLELFINESGNTIDWLAYEHGFTFGLPYNTFFPPGGPNPTATVKGRFNYVAADINYELRRPILDSWLKAMIHDYIEPAGGSVMLETKGYEILYDEASGSVAGVKARDTVNGTEYIINAKVVVTATGGYGGSSKRCAKWQAENKYYPMYASEDWVIQGLPASDGTMIEAAMNIGAGTWNLGALPPTADAAVPSEMHVYPVKSDGEKMNLI